MRQESINIYNYNDLLLGENEGVKLNVLNYIKDNWNGSFEDSYILEDFKTDMENLGFYDVKCYYTGFCSQGDGAVDYILEMIEANNYDFYENGKLAI